MSYSKEVNYKLINETALLYKQNKSQLLLNTLLVEYEPLIYKLYSQIHDYPKEEIKSIFIETLLTAIEKYDPRKNIKFNTFFFYYYRSIKRLCLKDNQPLKTYMPIDNEPCIIFWMDMRRILSEQEYFILSAYINGQSNWVKPMDTIYKKIRQYVIS